MKIFRTFVTAATAALASVAAFAEAPATRTFEQDGVTYEYTSVKLDSKTVLQGTANGRAPFRLVVTENKVRGTVDGKYVSFVRPKSVSVDATVLAAR